MQKSNKIQKYKQVSVWAITLFYLLLIFVLISCPNPVGPDNQDTDDNDSSLPSLSLYVSPTGSDSNDGLSSDNPKRTINAALQHISEGGTIRLTGGTYNESLDIPVSVLILGSYSNDFDDTDFQNYPTIIDASGTGNRVITAYQIDLDLQGLVLQNGIAGTGGGINQNGGSLNISQCTLVFNEATEWGGGGINAGNCVLTISNSIINNNIASRDTDSDGGGLNIEESTFLLDNVTVSFNECNGNAGGGIFLNNTTGTFLNCELMNNHGVDWGGGINGWNSSITLNGCTIESNTVNNSGGGVNSGGNPDYETIITNCTISNNSPDNITGSWIDGSLPTVVYAAVTPDHGDIGDTITLTGSGFGSGPGGIYSLYFGIGWDEIAINDSEVSFWSDTEIIFDVPNVLVAGDYIVQLLVSGMSFDHTEGIYPTFTIDHVYIAPPNGLTSTEMTSNSITMSWARPWNAVSYVLYRSTSLEGTYLEIASPVTQVFTDTGLSSDTTYYYKVSAVNSNNDESELSSAVAVTTEADASGTTYTVTYNGNGSDGGTVPEDSNNYEEGSIVTIVSAGTMIQEGYTFAGWNTAANGSGTARAVGSTFTMETVGIILFAQWTANNFIVTFDSLGGSSVSSQTVSPGETVTQPNNPTQSGNGFEGWYREETFQNRWDFSTDTVNDNMTLYANWYAATDGLSYTLINGNMEYEVSGGTTNGESVITIPDYWNGKKVTSIGSSAFYIYSLSSITIPDGVTTIGDRAFYLCGNLSSITIPTGVTSIEDYTFFKCSSLSSITIPSGVNSIGDYTFSDCYNLMSITISIDLTSIGIGAFRSCHDLMSINIPSGVTSIGSRAFYDCNSLTSIVIPDGITSIENDTFNRCNNLTSITIPDSVTSIGDSAFVSCSSLTSITIPNGVTAIENSTFSSCNALTSITIGTGVSSIGQGVFANCTSLTSVTIPTGVTSIGSAIFSGCSGLTSVTLPAGLTSTGESTFNGCSSLTSLPLGAGVTSIGKNSFANCTGLMNITIPTGITSIGDYAFANCSGLASITIGDDVSSIGNYSFSSCSNLTSIDFGAGVTSIGGDAFVDCISLTNIIIPDCVISIGDYAFHRCSSLTNITIGSGVTSIERGAFRYCTGLTTLNMQPTTAPILEDYVFHYVSSCTLHIHSGAAGYGGTPWTDTSIFSSISQDL